MGAGGAAAGMQLAGGLLGGEATRAQMMAEAALMRRNAEIARRNAGWVRQSAQAEAGMLREQGDRTIAKGIAVAAASNLALDSDTNQDIFAGNAANVEAAVQINMNDAWRRAMGYEMQADALQYQSHEMERQARMQMATSFLGAAGRAAGSVGGGSGGDVPQTGNSGPTYYGENYGKAGSSSSATPWYMGGGFGPQE